MKCRIALLGILLTTGGAFANEPVSVRAALADPHRPTAQIALDGLRMPGPLLQFAGLKTGDRIADFMSGNAYFTRLFSRVVGPAGHVYAVLPTEQLAHCAPDEVAGTQSVEHDSYYSNVSVLRLPAQQFAAPAMLDVVWLSQDYHDLHDQFMQPTDIARFNAAVFRSLRSGGVYLIVDHVAEAGSGLRDTESLHRIDPEIVRQEVTAAGFAFEAETTVLRRPADTHRLAVFDPSIRYQTDQFVFKFRKP